MSRPVELTLALRAASRAAVDAFDFAEASVNAVGRARHGSDEETSSMIVAILESRRAYLLALSLADQLLLRNDPRVCVALQAEDDDAAPRGATPARTKSAASRLRFKRSANANPNMRLVAHGSV